MIGLIVRLFFAFVFVFALFYLIDKDSLLSGHIPKGCEATPNNQTGQRIVSWNGQCYSKVWNGYDKDASSILPFAKGSNVYEYISWKAGK